MPIDNQRADITACLGKLEETYGVDPSPTPAANGILINKGASLTPNADKETRNVVRTTYSPAGSIIGAKYMDLALPVEARGGGLAADGLTPLPPDYDCYLRCSGMQRRTAVRLTLSDWGTWVPGETVTGGSSAAVGTLEYIEKEKLLVVVVTSGTFEAGEVITGSSSGAAMGNCTAVAPALLYQPITAKPSAQPSAATYFWMDSILHRHLGGRGSWSLSAEVGKLATIDFKLSGLWVDPTDTDLPVPVLTDLVGPQALDMGVTIGGYTPVCTALKLDLGAKVEKRNDINATEGLIGLQITGREPTGSLDPETDKLASYNPWAAWKTGAKSQINAYLGSTPGNRLAIHVGAAQRTDVKYATRVGLVNFAETFTPCQVRAGDDEIYLCFY